MDKVKHRGRIFSEILNLKDMQSYSHCVQWNLKELFMKK